MDDFLIWATLPQLADLRSCNIAEAEEYLKKRLEENNADEWFDVKTGVMQLCCQVDVCNG